MMTTKLKKIKPPKISKQDKLEFLRDIVAIREFAKHIWGDAIYYPDDFGMDILSWQWHLGAVVCAKDVKKTLKLHLKEEIEVK